MPDANQIDPARIRFSRPPPESRQFDFWIGEWDVIRPDGTHGSSNVEKILGGHVFRETYDAEPGLPLQGISIAIYNEKFRRWQFIWVDSGGHYQSLTGEFLDGRMILESDVTTMSDPHKERWVWFNITPDTYDWVLERSPDGGQTWDVFWSAHNVRKR